MEENGAIVGRAGTGTNVHIADPKTSKQTVRFQKNTKVLRGKQKRMIPRIPEKLKRDYLGVPQKYKLTAFNPFITCPICQGYLVDATTITECLHSFCRGCIIKQLEKSFHCPLCNELVHKTNPWSNLRSDTALQDIVEKLVPGFIEGEERRRRIFYLSRGLPVPQKVTKPDPPSHCNITPPGKCRTQRATPTLQPPTMYHEDDQITMQLEMRSMEEFTEDEILPLKRKYVRCSAHVTVGLLQKFIARKLKLEAANQIEILCSDTELGTDFTLHYIKESLVSVEDKCKPLLLHYGLTQLQ